MTDLQARINFALWIVGLGLATYEQIRQLWANEGVSDADLDLIIAEVDRRLARRQ